MEETKTYLPILNPRQTQDVEINDSDPRQLIQNFDPTVELIIVEFKIKTCSDTYGI